jgi:anti-anti-sigma factor
MRISASQDGPLTVVRLTGRLDGESARHLSDTIEDLLREGARTLLLDMSGVIYLSSAGTRVLARRAEDLTTLRGSLGVILPSDVVREALTVAGLAGTLLQDGGTERSSSPSGRFTQWGLPAIDAQHGSYEVSHYADAGVTLRLHGPPGGVLGAPVTAESCTTVGFPMESFGLGVGAIADRYEDAAPRLGELIAAEGIVAYLPSDGARVPDFMLSYADRAPQAVLATGITWRGQFTDLIRFSTQPSSDAVPLAELAEVCLEMTGARSVVMATVAEVGGVVGSSLRRSPTELPRDPTGAADPAQLREWMSFTPEPAHQGSTAVILGVVARQPTGPLAARLRPLNEDGSLMGHLHAAVFPYSPVPQRTVMLPALVGRLFQTFSLRDILHVMPDCGPGTGGSLLLRGVCWTAQIGEIKEGQ